MSDASRGSTTLPGSSIVAIKGARSESSMSVAATMTVPSLASTRMLPRTGTVLLVEVARPTADSTPARSSFAHVSRMTTTLPGSGSLCRPRR